MRVIETSPCPIYRDVLRQCDYYRYPSLYQYTFTHIVLHICYSATHVDLYPELLILLSLIPYLFRIYVSRRLPVTLDGFVLQRHDFRGAVHLFRTQ